jgi:hypothetical protein
MKRKDFREISEENDRKIVDSSIEQQYLKLLKLHKKSLKFAFDEILEDLHSKVQSYQEKTPFQTFPDIDIRLNLDGSLYLLDSKLTSKDGILLKTLKIPSKSKSPDPSESSLQDSFSSSQSSEIDNTSTISTL